MPENENPTTPTAEPPRFSANYNPIKVPIPIYLMFFSRSARAVEWLFKTYPSEPEFELLRPDLPMLRKNQLLTDSEFTTFTSLNNASGQAVSQLDVLIRQLFEMKPSDKLHGYRINGETKIIAALISDEFGSRKGEREITNTAADERGITFDKITEADAGGTGDHLIERVGQACFVYSAKADENSFLGRIYKVLAGE